jgi:hypothetical protein
MMSAGAPADPTLLRQQSPRSHWGSSEDIDGRRQHHTCCLDRKDWRSNNPILTLVAVRAISVWAIPDG